jgi:hypothetical protein
LVLQVNDRQLGMLMDSEKCTSYSEGRAELGLDQNFIHFLLSFIKGRIKL